jgi:hypothetical protein
MVLEPPMIDSLYRQNEVYHLFSRHFTPVQKGYKIVASLYRFAPEIAGIFLK